MSIITVSRGSFSGGKTLAECLAGKLGYRCVDRDVIIERAAASGISQADLRGALQKPPRLLERFSHKRYKYLALLQAALTEETRTGKVIYHGLAGHLLLPRGPYILRTRIIASTEYRIGAAQDRLKLSLEEAAAYIERVDRERKNWTQFLYGVNWGDPALYDIVLSLEYTNIEQACNTIATLALQRSFEITPQFQKQLDDMALASRVKAALAIHASTSELEVEVSADAGVVSVKGNIPARRLTAVEDIVRAVPGVTTLHDDRG
jgi:cytidylate kinase